MDKNQIKTAKRARRHKRIRAKVSGTSSVPRFSVFKSNKQIYVQLVDDAKNHSIAAGSSGNVSGKLMKDRASALGKEMAKKALALGVTKVVFDRGGYVYTGNVKALADGARAGGLIF